MSNFGWTIGFQRSEMVGVQFISIEIPVIRKTLKPNRTEILTKRYEKMFHFPKLAKSAGDLKLCNSLEEEFGPRRSWFLLVQCPGLWLCRILCIFFFLPSFSQASFHLFFSVASHPYLCHSQASPAKIGRKISLFINSQVSPKTCQTRCWLAPSPVLPL